MPERKPDQPHRREESTEYMKQYREQHGDKMRENDRAAYAENREARVDYSMDYYYRNREDPDFKRRRRSCRLKSKYGITLDDYEDMAAEQKGCCKICGEYMGEALRVDHCHTTGKVRGLLCNGCNVGLGNFKDSPEALLSAITYLREAKYL